jgi:hypothetical protein
LDDFGARSPLEHTADIAVAGGKHGRGAIYSGSGPIVNRTVAQSGRFRKAECAARRLECRNGLARCSIPGRTMKKADALLPEGEGLRRAVAWLAEQPIRDLQTIEEASRRFNLSPLDEDFLLQHFRGPARGEANG